MLVQRNRHFPYLIFIITIKLCYGYGTGITLPPFRQLAHNLQSGPIEIINGTSIQISDLYYDGRGPDAHFWVGRGAPGPDGILVPDEYNSTKSLPMYTGKNITIYLPNNLTMASIDYLAVWCIKYKHNFGHVFMNERYIKTNRSALFLPLHLKPFNSSTVTSDSVTIEMVQEEVKISISNMYYNQTGKNVHFRVGSGKPSSNSKLVPNESVQTLPSYNGQNISLELPKNVSLGDVTYLAVWDDDNKTSLGTVYFNRKLPQDQSIDVIGVQLDAFRNNTHRLYSGPVLLINEKVFYVSNLHHSSIMTQFRVSLKNGTTQQIPDETGSYSHLKTYNGDCFYIKLPTNITVTDINKFGIWNDTQGYLSYVALNSTIKVPTFRQYPDVTNDGKRIIRVPKCCPLGHVVADTGCAKQNVDFDVQMKLHLANDTHLNDDPMIGEWIVFAPYINNIDCPKYYLVPEMDNYSLLTTGKLLYISAKEQLPIDKYCMDGVYHVEDGKVKGKYINTPFVCAETDSGPQTMHIAFAVCAFLSAISLFLVTAIYFLIRKQNDKRGFSTAGYALSMGIAFTCLAITQIAGLETVCKVLGGFFHFFIVMSFVWFVVITYEAFYHVKFFDQNSVLEDYTKRRKVYIILSMILPLVFVVCAYILNLPSGLLNTHLDAICLFNNEKWMLYVPIIISIVLAIALTGYSKYQIGVNDNIPKDDMTKRFIWRQVKGDCQARVRFCLFLVTLTAICWISEIITFSLRFSYIVLDFIHALQGVMVLMTIVSTDGIYKRIIKVFSGSDTPTQNGINGRNDYEMRKLNPN